MTRPSLLVLSFSPIASDARVLKQVRLFAERYDVTTCGYGPAPEGVVRHLQVPDDAVYWRKDTLALLTFRHRAVLARNAAVAAARPLLAGLTFDVVLADDVDAVPLALDVAPRLASGRAAVHADLHEYAPAQNEELLRWRLFVAPYVRWLLRRYVTQAASVTTVAPGIAEAYRREYGLDAGVVVNAAPYAEREPGPVHSPVRLVHSGAGLANRFLDHLVDAAERTSLDCTLDLFLVRNDPAYVDDLRARTAGSARVTVHDPVPYAELGDTLAAYDLGIYVLPEVNRNNAMALPNKIFDFVQARLGLVLGPNAEMARLVREHGLGAVASANTAEALAAALDAVTSDDVARWKAASHAAARALSAEEQSGAWARAVDAIAAAPR
ncbi:glycosyltransferase family 4 protein [Sanguibacter sp. HDW7]|uniref:glycosyltransferase family 4 protein n=1 Tax=Sanguibacter sp. HDW7 TaxID=2714931 RepID=UPI00140DC111|nr:glycosyltransferase family 4 protein [Sanguibacter sp. HDW7]QIK84129.1 glycosyltransferase family 4 protein [Sanguibacter sp. HDW7]